MPELTLRVESNKSAPGLSRSRLVRMKSELGVRFDDVLLVVSELVSNSVRHSHTRGIDVKVEALDGHIRVEVSDDGPGFAQDQPRGEGLGLGIVERLAEHWGIVAGDRFTVWAELSRIS